MQYGFPRRMYTGQQPMRHDRRLLEGEGAGAARGNDAIPLRCARPQEENSLYISISYFRIVS